MLKLATRIVLVLIAVVVVGPCAWMQTVDDDVAPAEVSASLRSPEPLMGPVSGKPVCRYHVCIQHPQGSRCGSEYRAAGLAITVAGRTAPLKTRWYDLGWESWPSDESGQWIWDAASPPPPSVRRLALFDELRAACERLETGHPNCSDNNVERPTRIVERAVPCDEMRLFFVEQADEGIFLRTRDGHARAHLTMTIVTYQVLAVALGLLILIVLWLIRRKRAGRRTQG